MKTKLFFALFRTALFFALFIFFTASVINIQGCSFLSSKPHMKVDNFNDKPCNDPEVRDNINILRSAGKDNIVYPYKLKGVGVIDSEKYKKDHPKDALVISFTAEEGYYTIIVYSFSPIPDPKYSAD